MPRVSGVVALVTLLTPVLAFARGERDLPSEDKPTGEAGITNSAYNRDRGPAQVSAVRLHVAF